MLKKQNSSVYCRNCKYFDPPCSDEYSGPYPALCRYHDKIKISHDYVNGTNKKTKYSRVSPYAKNRNGNCEHYKRSILANGNIKTILIVLISMMIILLFYASIQ